MKDERIYLLEKEKVSKAINIMAAPAIVGFLVMAIYNVVDTIFVAWLGTNATGATQVVLPITMLVTAFGLMFGIGGGTYLSRLLGMKKQKHAEELAIVTLVSGLLSGIFFIIMMQIFINPLLSFFGATDTLMPMSIGYGRYIIMGSAFVMGNMAMNNLLRAEGSAKFSMIGMAFGAVLNIFLDPLFIFVFDMGIEGAAIATSISQGFSFFMLYQYYHRKRTVIQLSLKNFKPSKDMYSEISKVGVPTFFRQLLFSISIAYLNQNAMGIGGAELLAAVGLVFKITMLPSYVIFGIGQGYQPVVGYNFGAKNDRRIMEAFRYAMTISIVFAIIAGLAISIFSAQILAVFKPEEQVVAYASLGIRLNALALSMLAISNTISIFYQAIGRGKESLVLSISRQGIFFIPAIYFMPIIFSGNGILASQLVADACTLLLSSGLIVSYFTKGKLQQDIITQTM